MPRCYGAYVGHVEQCARVGGDLGCWNITSKPTASSLPSLFQQKAVTVRGSGRLHRRCQLRRCTLRLLFMDTRASRSIVGHQAARATSLERPLFSNSVKLMCSNFAQFGHGALHIPSHEAFYALWSPIGALKGQMHMSNGSMLSSHHIYMSGQ